MVKELSNLNELNEEVSEGISLIDCYAIWCGPCKMLAPIIEEISEMNVIKTYKVDVDKANDIANKYQIMSIPTLLLFKDGVHINTLIGFRPKESILDIIKSIK